MAAVWTAGVVVCALVLLCVFVAFCSVCLWCVAVICASWCAGWLRGVLVLFLCSLVCLWCYVRCACGVLLCFVSLGVLADLAVFLCCSCGDWCFLWSSVRCACGVALVLLVVVSSSSRRKGSG